jgi:acyl phosphate:glycerol-3-phosphate acyltransferase
MIPALATSILRSLLILLLCAYLLGSVPFGYLLYRWRRGADIRSTGSGNIGATNVYRAAGLAAAVLTFLLDAGKGYLAVLLAGRLSDGAPTAVAGAAFAVMLGHCFPVFLNFRGGKAVATGLGAFLAVSPLAVLCSATLFIVVLTVRRYVSLASMAGAAAFPIALLIRGGAAPAVLVASFAGAVLIIIRHRGNIQRLRAGTEARLFGR